MIIPSIDIMDGRAVQLRQGREKVLDGGDPMERLEQFSVAGEVAVVDLDAALGRGSNAALIGAMVRQAACRIGGGIRTVDSAVEWLDAGARRVMIGTAASVEFCSQLPRDRVIAAVDCYERSVVVDGWRQRTEHDALDRIRALAPHVGGILMTQVEHEGGLAGFDRSLVEAAAEAAGDARLTAAGGITTTEDIAQLDSLGVDAQVGMALYNESLTLGDAVAGLLGRAVDGDKYATVVCDESGIPLGLVWSTKESVKAAVNARRGMYWSRSRNEMWIKGETSGNTQELIRVDFDCDRDALRFTVRQSGTGFCHVGTRGCWPTPFGLETLERTIHRRRDGVQPAGSGTARLLDDDVLLTNKLLEEVRELAAARTGDHAEAEFADVVYFALVALAKREGHLAHAMHELERRSLRATRRPMESKSS